MLSETLDAMKIAGHKPSATTYRVLAKHHAGAGNTLMCLRTLQEMKENGLSPDLVTVEAIVLAVCQGHQPRLAHDLAVEYEEKTARRLPLSTWTNILAASAHGFYVS
jgi:pentatricopeptide repeat protein